MHYEIKDLGELADYFATLASDQRHCIRMQRTRKAKHECEIRAATYDDAADTIRKTRIK